MTPPDLRHRTDPLADATLAALVAGVGLEAANHALATVALHRGPLPEDLPGPLTAYFARSGDLPPWADPAQLAAGAELFARHGPFLLVALICASLPECYTMAKGVQVLALTGRMDGTHAYRRVYETAQYVVDVLAPQGLEPGGKGIKAAQKVRLMHAGIRHLLLSDAPAGIDGSSRKFTHVLLSTTWDSAALGQPICQEDALFTLLTFSLVALRAMDAWGIPVSAELRQGWMHRWAVIGHLMGIEDHLIPRTEADAARVFADISAKEAGSTPQAVELTRTLSLFFGEVIHNAHLGRIIAPLAIRSMVPTATADLLHVPKSTPEVIWLGRLLQRFLRFVIRSETPWEQKFISRILVRALTKLPKAWKPGLFEIPTELTARWSA